MKRSPPSTTSTTSPAKTSVQPQGSASTSLIIRNDRMEQQPDRIEQQPDRREQQPDRREQQPDRREQQPDRMEQQPDRREQGHSCP